MAIFTAKNASRFGNDGTPFIDAATDVPDLISIDLVDLRQSLITGLASSSTGRVATVLATTDSGAILTSMSDTAGIRTPAGTITDTNGGLDLLTTRSQLLSVSSKDRRRDGRVPSTFTLNSRLVPGIEAVLLRNGVAIDRRTADSNGAILWPLSGVPVGTHTFSLSYPGQQVPVAASETYATSSLTVSVANIGPNSPPTDIELSGNSLAENAGVNASIGTLTTTDPNTGDVFTYSLVAGDGATDNSLFNINGAALRASNSLNYELKNSYSVRVRTTDQEGASFEKVFNISVSDVNEPATDISLSNATLAENAGADAVVGTLSAVDPDASNTHTFALASGGAANDNSLFSVVGTQLRAIASLDLETKSSYAVRVRATDQDGAVFDKVLTVTLTNVNESPTDVTLSKTTVSENAGPNALVGTLSTTDPDAGDTFTYTLVAGVNDTDNATFNISGNQLRATASLFAATKSNYSVRVRSTDQGGLSFEKSWTITLTPPNQAPTDIALSNLVIAENAAANAVVGTLSTTDLDSGDTFTYSLVDGAGATGNSLFNINAAQLRATLPLDYDTQSSHSVRVRTTDAGGLSFD
ncbi:MAG: cadherin repeat domain-containing protein, partial [Planctomycetota bacterium]